MLKILIQYLSESSKLQILSSMVYMTESSQGARVGLDVRRYEGLTHELLVRDLVEA